MLANGKFLAEIIRSVVILVLMSLLVGLAYPLLMMAVGQAVFPKQVNGSLIYNAQGQVLGSSLIGQNFTAAGDFWTRPSPSGYNALASGGSNLGPTNPQLLAYIQKRINLLQSENPNQVGPIPIDLVTASGSGLDPDISVAAAEYQANRVAVARHLDIATVNQLIAQNTVGRTWGIIGEPYVNVWQLNRVLDAVGS